MSVSALAAAPAITRPTNARDYLSKLPNFFIFLFPTRFPSLWLKFFPPYGSVTERILAENVPPVQVPEIFSATPAPSRPTLPGGKDTVKVAVPPAAMIPPGCGNGVPEVVPNVAAFRTTFDAGPVPVFLTVMAKV